MVDVLQHELAPHYRELRQIRTRTQLEKSALWATIGPEVLRVLDALDVHDAPDVAPLPRTFRAVAWNIQRGQHLEALIAMLRADPELAGADVLFLSEVDCGMGRSGNRHVARELAAALGMSYAFGVSYLALEDDYLENPDNTPNTLALAGNAILARAPILRAVNADVPAVRDKFGSSEKRLGRKRAVVAQVATAAGPVTLAQAHLDSNASSPQRAAQLASILDEVDRLAPAPAPALLGGDLNTTTWQYSSALRLARDLMHKFIVTGFRGTLNNYLTPDQRYERPVFELLRARAFAIAGFNARGGGTIRYDFNEPYAIAKVHAAVGGVITRALLRRLAPWNNVVEAHLDWFAGRHLTGAGARVVRQGGPPASDHDPILVDVTI